MQAVGRFRHREPRAAPATAWTFAREDRSACPATCPGEAPASAPVAEVLDDRDISQLADGCQAGAVAR
jgi:hypothetical protein